MGDALESKKSVLDLLQKWYFYEFFVVKGSYFLNDELSFVKKILEAQI
jgi:hypothetical protein